MKFLKYILPLFFVFLMAGCLDIDEKVDIKKDGSGQMAMDMDASQAIAMLQQYMGKEELAKKGVSRMDTTIQLKDIVDTVKSLDAAKKAILRNGTMHLNVDLDQKIFKTHMQFPFTSYGQLQDLYRALSDGSLGSTNLLGGLGGQEMQGASPDLNQFNGVYTVTCKDGSMSKKLDKDKWNKLINDPQLGQMKQASQMGIEILYTTTISLPRPVKNIDNPLAKVSDDKKSVTIKYNLIDIFEKPDQFTYSIEF